MTQWIRPLNTAISVMVSLILFFVPLLLYPKTSEVFEFNKMMFVYLAVALTATLWLFRTVLEKRILIAKTPLDLPILLYVLTQLLSTIVSIDPHTSLWGYYSRFHGGLFSTLAYIIFFYAVVSHYHYLKKKNLSTGFFSAPAAVLKLWLYSLISSAILVAFYGILEHFGIDKHLWVQDVQSRVFSTLGQPNWLSAYLVALLPLPLFLAYHTSRRTRALTWSAVTLLFLLCLYYTKSRSGIGTTFLILTLAFVHLSVTALKQKRFIKVALLGLSIFLLTLLAGTPFTPSLSEIFNRLNQGGPVLMEIEPQLNRLGISSQFKPAPQVELSPKDQADVAARAQGKLVGGSDSMDIRRVVWQGSLGLLRSHPTLGTGVETFGYAYYWTRPAAHNLLSEWDFLYNKAHNEYLNFLATTGIVGFSAYVILLFTILTLFLRRLKLNDPLPAALFYGWLSILITNFFGFSVVPVAVLFFFYPALILSLYPLDLRHVNFGYSKKPSEPGTAAIIVLSGISLSFLFVATIIVSHWLADINYNQGKSYAAAQYLLQSLPYLERSVSLYPGEPVFRAELAQAQAQTAVALDAQIKSASVPNQNQATPSAAVIRQAESQRDNYAVQAKDNIVKALDDNPYNLNTYKTKAKVEIYLGSLDPQYYQSALSTLAKANELAPTDPKIVYNIGLLYDHLKKPALAETAYRKTLELKPNYDQARVSYIALLTDQNRLDDARTQYQALLNDYPQYEGKFPLLEK